MNYKILIIQLKIFLDKQEFTNGEEKPNHESPDPGRRLRDKTSTSDFQQAQASCRIRQHPHDGTSGQGFGRSKIQKFSDS